MDPYAAAFNDECMILEAIPSGQLDIPDKRKTDLSEKPPVICGFCPIHYAALNNSLKAIEYLVSRATALSRETVTLETENKLKYVVYTNSTPLHIAVLSNSEGAAGMLAKYINECNEQNAAPLHFASALGRVWAASMLIEELPRRDNYGNSAVGISCLFGRYEFLEELYDVAKRQYSTEILLFRLTFERNAQAQTPADLALQPVQVGECKDSCKLKNLCYQLIIDIECTARDAVERQLISDYGLEALIEEHDARGDGQGVERGEE